MYRGKHAKPAWQTEMEAAGITQVGSERLAQGLVLVERKEHVEAIGCFTDALELGRCASDENLMLQSLEERMKAHLDLGLFQEAHNDAEELKVEDDYSDRSRLMTVRCLLKEERHIQACSILLDLLKDKPGKEWLPTILALNLHCILKIETETAETMMSNVDLPQDASVWTEVLTLLSQQDEWKGMCTIILGSQSGPDTVLDCIATEASARNVNLSGLFASDTVSLSELKEWGVHLAVSLLKQGAHIESLASGSTEPLHFPVVRQSLRMEHPKLLKYVLDHTDLDINAKNKDGDTAIHVVVKDRRGSSQSAAAIIGTLHQMGADRGVRDASGKTPQEYLHPSSDLYQALVALSAKEAASDAAITRVKSLKEAGNKAFKGGYKEQAVDHYLSAIEVAKGCGGTAMRQELAVLYANLSAAFMDLGDYAKATANARTCLQYNDTYQKGFWRLGQALSAEDKLVEAFEAYNKGAWLCQCDRDDGAKFVREMAFILLKYGIEKMPDGLLADSKTMFDKHWLRFLDMMTKDGQWECLANLMLGECRHPPRHDLETLWFDPRGFMAGRFCVTAELATVLDSLSVPGCENWLPDIVIQMLMKGANLQRLGCKEYAHPLHAVVHISAATKTVHLLEDVINRMAIVVGNQYIDPGKNFTVFHTALEHVGPNVDHPMFLKLLRHLTQLRFRINIPDSLGRYPQDMVPYKSKAYHVLQCPGIRWKSCIPQPAGTEAGKKADAAKGKASGDSNSSQGKERATNNTSDSAKGKKPSDPSPKSKNEAAREKELLLKNKAMALQIKESGNLEFRRGHFKDAILLYNQALQLLTKTKVGMTIQESQDLSVLYSNRSECQLRLGNTQQALEDAVESVSYNATWFRAHMRVGRAQLALCNYSKAALALSNAYTKLGKPGEGPGKDRMHREILCDIMVAHLLSGREHEVLTLEVEVPRQLWLRVSYDLFQREDYYAAQMAFAKSVRLGPCVMKDVFEVNLKEFCNKQVLEKQPWLANLILHCLQSGSKHHTLSFSIGDTYLHAAVVIAYTTNDIMLLDWLFQEVVHPQREENVTDTLGNTVLHLVAKDVRNEETQHDLIHYLVSNEVDPAIQNKKGLCMHELVPPYHHRAKCLAVDVFHHSSAGWLTDLCTLFTQCEPQMRTQHVHARQRKPQVRVRELGKQDSQNTSTRVQERRTKDTRKTSEASPQRPHPCDQCRKVVEECQGLMETDGRRAINKLSGLINMTHKGFQDGRHYEIVTQCLNLVAEEISKTLTPDIPQTILSLPEAKFEQILQRLAAQNKWRQLEAAVRQFHAERGEQTLKNFARNMSVVDVANNSSLCSAEQVRLDVLKLLLAHGAKLTLESAAEAIAAAMRNQEYHVVETLLTCGANPSAISLSPGDTPLHAALTVALERDKGNFSLFDKLVELGELQREQLPQLSPQCTDSRGNTLLHLASGTKYTKHALKAVEKLCSLGVPPDYVNDEGKMALQLLTNRNDRRAQFLRVSLQTLPQSGAKTSVPKKNGAKKDSSQEKEPQKSLVVAEEKEEKEEKVVSAPVTVKPANTGVLARQRIQELIDERPYPISPLFRENPKKKGQAERQTKEKSVQEGTTLQSSALEENSAVHGAGDACPKPASKDKKIRDKDRATEAEKTESTVEEEEEEEGKDSGEEEAAEEGEAQGEEVDISAFDNLEWEVECTADVWKTLGDKKVPIFTKQRIVGRIQQLAQGEWRKHMTHPVDNAPPKLQLFKGRLGSSIWLLWELAIAFSPRLSQAAEQRMQADLEVEEAAVVAVKGGRMYSELIRVWDIVLDGAHLTRSIERIFKSHNRGQTCLIQRKLYGLKDARPNMVGSKRLPRIFSESEVGLEQQQQMMLYPPASANQTEFHILKFYSFNAALVSNILRNIQTKVDFPFRVTDREHAIIHLQSTAPLLLLGRSGTGKTTCCLYRLWALFQAYWSRAQHSGPMLPRTPCFLSGDDAADAEENAEEEEEGGALEMEDLNSAAAPISHHQHQHHQHHHKHEEDDVAAVLDDLDEGDESEGEKEETVYDHLHQVFVTKNVVLCTEVHKNFSELCQASDVAPEHMARMRNRDALPTRLQDADDFNFPLFVTSRQLLLMMDASLPGEPFFQRSPDGSLKHRITGWGTQAEIFTPIGIDHDSDHEDGDHSDDDSDDNAGLENVEEARVAEAAAKKRGERQKREVTYNVFVSEVWTRFSKRERSHYHPSLVWMEIMSFIKGSFEALSTKTGFLSRDGYQELGRKRAPNFSGERDRVYDLFERYRDLCHQMALFDEADLVYHLYHRLRLLDNQPWAIHQVFVDETQDFTQAELCVLLRLSQNPNDMFLTGDTAQSIMRGISFRFADLKSLFFYARRSMQALGKTAAICVPKKVYQLTHNYRSHAGILRLASAVLDLLQGLFPESFDQLQPDQGLFPGPAPVLLQSGSPGDLALILRGNQRKTSHIEFGAHQAILVVSEEAREKLPEELSMGLVLTIYEAKGLEFDDVLLYNFFTDSEASKEWRVVTKFLEELRTENLEKSEDLVELDESVLDQTGRPRPLTFDPNQHKVLNSELKHLYTAITRARVNVWIFDQNEDKRAPMFEYFRARRLVREVTVTEEEAGLEETMFAEKSSTSEWIKRGDEIMRRGLYDVAAKCYRLGGDADKEAVALAHRKALLASRNRDNPKQMREDFLQAALMFLECGLDKKAALCLLNAKEVQLAALAHEKSGMMEQAARLYQKMRSMEDASRCYEHMGWYNKAVEVLQQEELYEKAIDCLQRYEQLKKDLKKTKGTIPPELLAREPKPEYNIERLSYNLAKRHHKNGNTAKMLEALDRVPNISDRINFLKDKKYFKEASRMMAASGQETEAAQLILGEGCVSEALTLAAKGGDKKVKADCHLAMARKLFREMASGVTHHLDQARLLYQEVQCRGGVGEAQLIQAQLQFDSKLARFAHVNFHHSKPIPNMAGQLEALDIFIRISSATDFTRLDAEAIIQGIDTTFRLIRLFLGTRTSEDQLSYFLFLAFYGLTEAKRDESGDYLILRPAESPRFLEFVNSKCWIFQKGDFKKPQIFLKAQDACQVLCERLLQRVEAEWLGCVISYFSSLHTRLAQCMEYRQGADCENLEEGACLLIHQPYRKDQCLDFFQLLLMQVRLCHILDEGVAEIQKLTKMQKLTEMQRKKMQSLVDIASRCCKMKMTMNDDDDQNPYWQCQMLLLFLVPDGHQHRLLTEGNAQYKRSLLEVFRSKQIRVPMERYFRYVWNGESKGPGLSKDALLKSRVRRTDTLVKLTLLGPLFAMSLKAHDMSENLVIEIRKLKPSWLKRANRYALLKDERHDVMQTLATRFMEAYECLLGPHPDPVESLIRFTKFVKILSDRDKACLFPDLNFTLLLLEFFTALGLLLAAKTSQRSVTIPASYLAAVSFVELTTAHKDNAGICLQKIMESMPNRKPTAFIRERMEKIVGLLCGYRTRFSLINFLFLLGEKDADAWMLKERGVVLILTLLANIPIALEASCEIPLLQAIHRIFLGGNSPSRLATTLAKVRDARGLRDVADTLSALLYARDEEYLFQAQWSRWNPKTRSMVRLHKVLDPGLYQSTFYYFDKTQHANNEEESMSSANLEDEMENEELMTEEEARRLAETLQERELEKLFQKAGRTVLRILRHAVMLQRLKRLRFFLTRQLEEEMFRPFAITDTFCGICGVPLKKPEERREEEEAGEGEEEGLGEQIDQPLDTSLREEVTVTKAEHLCTPDHVEKKSDFDMFRKEYNQQIGPALNFVGPYITKYELRDEETRENLYKEMSLDINGLISLYSEVNQLLRQMMLSRNWHMKQEVMKKLYEIRKTFSHDLQQFVEHKHKQLKKEEQIRALPAQTGPQTPLEVIDDDLEGLVGEPNMEEQTFPRFNRRRGLRRQRPRNQNRH